MRIDTFVQNQNINLSNASAILDRVKVGEIVRAQILEISTNEIILKLFDGSTINASISEASEIIDAKRGDFVDFNVKEKLDGKVFLEVMKSSIAKAAESSEELGKQLRALGIPADTENIEIMKELKSNNITVNKGNFDRVLDIISGFKDINPAKAAFLIANKLGAEEKNISALKQLVDEKVKISQSIDRLLNSIDSVNDEVLVKNISDKLFLRKDSDTTPKPIFNLPETDRISINPSAKEAVIDEISNLLKDANKNTIKLQGTQNSASDDASILEKINVFFKNNHSSTENLSEKFSNFIERNIINHGKLLQDSQDQVPQLIKNIMWIIKSKETSENDILNNRTTLNYDKADFIKIEDHKKEIRNVLDKLHVNLNSDNLKDELNIKNLYKDLYSKLEIIKESIYASTISNKAEITSNIEHMENNIRFMNQLNTYNTYVQIPLSIWDRNTTGEIYLLKRGAKKRKIDPENATMLISLNTENLGQVDTFIDVNKKNINISMRVEDEEIIDFVKGFHKELYERMQEKGYKLVDLKFRITEEDINLINVNEVAKKEFNPEKVSIDYRL